eukprot:GEZU01004664.1.p1 GENE.GEZU01004664.1~~GEZU01004664.1.p1  ORF type:complete len:140 (-),score=69.05 GEZU01004664.1:161-580(-)
MADQQQIVSGNNTNSNEESGNKIQVSSNKRTLFFYVNLAKKFLAKEPVVELSGLGNAINTVVSCAEILKNSNVAVVNKIETSTVEVSGEGRQRPIQKAKIQIFLSKSDKFDEVIAQQQKEQQEREQQRLKESQQQTTQQ